METLPEWIPWEFAVPLIAVFGILAVVCFQTARELLELLMNFGFTLERFCSEHGYRYLGSDEVAKAKARPLVGEDTFDFVSGTKGGHPFLYCIQTLGEETRDGVSSYRYYSSNVIVDLRRPVP